MRALLALAVLAALAAPWGAPDGAAAVVTPRVVGGEQAGAGAWPSIVALVPGGTTSAFCGGTLIDPLWVLTAAHCNPTTSTDVLSGRLTLTSEDGQRIAVQAVYEYPGSDDLLHYDATLVRLAAPATAATTDLVPLGDDPALAPGNPAHVAGWGFTEEDGSTVDTLREATVTLLDDALCAERYDSFDPVSSLCAGELAGGVDTCQGDSGGPLEMEVQGHRVLVGLTSYGYGCARQGVPAVYARVAAIRDWITQTLGLLLPTAPRGVVAEPVVGGARARWDAPASAGSRALTGFLVQVLPAGPSLHVGPQARSATITGLPRGATVALAVTAETSAGAGPAARSSTSVLPIATPVAEGVPTVTGSATRGETLVASGPGWDGTPDAVTYRWEREDGAEFAPIPGAGGDRYAVGADDLGRRLRVVAVAVNAAGSGEAASDPVGPALDAPTAPPGETPAPAGDPPATTDAPAITGRAASFPPVSPSFRVVVRHGTPYLSVHAALARRLAGHTLLIERRVGRRTLRVASIRIPASGRIVASIPLRPHVGSGPRGIKGAHRLSLRARVVGADAPPASRLLSVKVPAAG